MFSLFKKKDEVVVPPLNWWDQGVANNTPDIGALERKQYNLVFIPDEFMKAHFMHKKLENFIDLNVKAFTKNPYSFVKKDLGKVSQAIPMETMYAGVPYARIRGELYALRASEVIKLDNYKENGVQYLRKKVKLLIPYRKLSKDWWAKEKTLYEAAIEQTPFWDETLEAFMYVGAHDYWDTLITQGWDDQGDHKLLKTTYRRVDGHFRKVLKNAMFKPIKVFEPNNKKLEKYYYYSTFHEFNGGGLPRSM